MRTEYAEVQEINRVSYRSMHTTTKVGKKWIPETARVIPGSIAITGGYEL